MVSKGAIYNVPNGSRRKLKSSQGFCSIHEVRRGAATSNNVLRLIVPLLFFNNYYLFCLSEMRDKWHSSVSNLPEPKIRSLHLSVFSVCQSFDFETMCAFLVVICHKITK